MKVDIRPIKKAIGMSMPHQTKSALDFKEINLFPQVEVDFKLSNVGERIIVEGRMQGVVKLICNRCLETFDWGIDLKVKEEFMEAKDAPHENKETSAVEEDLNVFLYKDDVIDLREVIRQNIISSIPIKPLCRADCKGICPVCGNNNNMSECSCQKE